MEPDEQHVDNMTAPGQSADDNELEKKQNIIFKAAQYIHNFSSGIKLSYPI